MTLANGELNPLARGLMITNATVGLIRTADGKWALDARGLVSLVGLPGAQGVSASGQVHVRVNSFTQAIDETLRIEGTSNDVVVKFATGQTANGTTPYASLTATGMRLDVLGASLTGDFSFAKQGDGLTITATNVAMSFGGVADGTSARGPPVSFTNGSGTFTAGATGITADFAGTLALNLPGVSTTSTFRIKVDPTSVAISATDVTLDILGNTLTGDFSFEQSGGHDAPRHRGRDALHRRRDLAQGDQRRAHDQRRRRHRPPRRHGRHPRDRRAHAHERRAEHRPELPQGRGQGRGLLRRRPDAHRRPRDHAHDRLGRDRRHQRLAASSAASPASPTAPAT